MRIEFINEDGERVEDVVRGFFNAHVLREPYAPNEIVPAVILTNYSWIPLSQISRIVEEEDPKETPGDTEEGGTG